MLEALKMADVGTPVADVCSELGINHKLIKTIRSVMKFKQKFPRMLILKKLRQNISEYIIEFFSYRRLFFVESPFQVLCANELIWSYSSFEDSIVVVRLNSLPANNRQIENVINFLFSHHNCKVRIVRCDGRVASITAIFFNYLRVNSYVFGDENSIVFRFWKYLIPKKRLLLIDDGTAAFSYSGRYRHFSELATDKPFQFLRNMLPSQIQGRREIIIILGSSLVETGIMTSENYRKVVTATIKKILTNINLAQVGLIYIPHRVEQIRVDDILERFGVKIHYSQLPAELLPHELGMKIVNVVGFGSTALLTVKKIYSITTTSIKIDANLMLKDVQIFEVINQKLQECGVKIEEIMDL